ncbi:hypothetical protein, partial [Micromonospora carbonacea]|uniref:hypothetical protein n=1 Tax=Micromonospora carbonacea TaxID=47853 RepID=UPI0033F88C3A
VPASVIDCRSGCRYRCVVVSDPAYDTGRRRVPAPTYPFAATRHYLDAPATHLDTEERHH